VIGCYFFFSSRRRHTRSKRDWSSDVCSSDLAVGRDIAVDDTVTILADPDNPALVGAVYRVASQVPRSQGTRQRVLLEDNQKGVRSEERRVGKECGCE